MKGEGERNKRKGEGDEDKQVETNIFLKSQWVILKLTRITTEKEFQIFVKRSHIRHL